MFHKNMLKNSNPLRCISKPYQIALAIQWCVCVCVCGLLSHRYPTTVDGTEITLHIDPIMRLKLVPPFIGIYWRLYFTILKIWKIH